MFTFFFSAVFLFIRFGGSISILVFLFHPILLITNAHVYIISVCVCVSIRYVRLISESCHINWYVKYILRTHIELVKAFRRLCVFALSRWTIISIFCTAQTHTHAQYVLTNCCCFFSLNSNTRNHPICIYEHWMFVAISYFWGLSCICDVYEWWRLAFAIEFCVPTTLII